MSSTLLSTSLLHSVLRPLLSPLLCTVLRTVRLCPMLFALWTMLPALPTKGILNFFFIEKKQIDFRAVIF